MKKLARLVLPLLIIITAYVSAGATTYYVSYSAGNDTYTGTSLAAPFKTITKAVAVAVAGDIIYLRGEVHYYSTKISISKSGTSSAKYYLLAYPGDASRPIIDFSAMAINSSNRGIDLSGSYWFFKGFDIYKAGDNGMHVSGSYNTIEFCAFYENADTGLQLDNGASYNQVVNCDSYYNIDVAEGNADGFAVKLNVGTGNAFRGCRAWQNSDDGWDGLLTAGLGTNPSTTYDSCWCFLNGYKKNMAASAGNGNGFKMGGNQEQHDATLRNCLSVYNRVKGFDQNNNIGSMVLYNCTGYKNKPNFGMNNYDPASGKVMVVKNCVSYLGQSADVFRSVATLSNNSWQAPLVTDNSDFVSLDTSVLRSPRNSDGSLPAISFMNLAQGSDLINAGTNVGLPYYGSAPDVGYAESNYAFPVTLLSFSAVRKNNNAVLSWRTAAELQNQGWEIEKLSGNLTWRKIGFVAAKAAGGGDYSFTDNEPLTGTVQYRLKQVDNNGYTRYSNVVTLKAGDNAPNRLSAFPNPAVNITTINYTLDHASGVTLAFYNTAGQKVYTVAHEKYGAGSHSVNVNTASLPAGQYYCRLTGDTFISIIAFVKAP